MQPLVSIIIPTYNRAHLIGETLDSVIAQSYTNWECMVVDDGSTDYTEELMEFYCTRDSRFQYHHRPEDRIKGANACRNYGFERSEGILIQYLDSDDLISKTKIEEQITLISGNGSSIATTKWGVFNNRGRDFFDDLKAYKNFSNAKDFLKAMYKSYGYFPSHAYLINRSIIEKAGGWNERLKINQDGEFMIRIICNCDQFYFAKNSYVLYRASRSDSTSIITQENIFDHYHCLKLIEAQLMIRFKEDIPEFEIIKRKAFLRIPDELSNIYRDEMTFFEKQIREKRKNKQPIKELKKKIKSIIRAIS